MLVKGNFKKVRMIGHGKVSVGRIKRMGGDGIFSVLKGLFSGGVKMLGNLFRSSGAKQLAQKAISSGSQLAKDALKEGAKSVVKEIASDPVKAFNTASDLVNKIKDSANPQEVAQQEAKNFSKQILNIAKEKVVQPTIDQYRDEFEGVKEKAKADVQSAVKKQQEDIQANLGNLIAGMGLKKQVPKGGIAQRGKGSKVSRVDLVKNSKSKSSSGNNKIMNKLRGAGLVPL